MGKKRIIQRELEKKLHKLATQYPVVSLLGPRQAGKTTLAKQAFPTHTYLSLEDLELREFATTDPKGFLKTYLSDQGIILDEVQYAPHLFSYIQVYADEHNQAGAFILTGSQNFLLNKHISQSLAGRVAILNLLPFSIDELKSHHALPQSYEELLYMGGYPRIHTDGHAPNDWYPNYIRTYIERDVRDLKNIDNLLIFQTFIRLCAGRAGQVINWSDLARDAGISEATAKSWATILEASYIIFFLKPFHSNVNKRLIKSPKLYFYDTGLVCSLLRIKTVEQLSTHYLKGNLFENMMLCELIKKEANQGNEPYFYFWRDRDGHEIDCIIDDGGTYKAIEIKSGQTISPHFFKELKYWKSVAEGATYLVYGGESLQKRTHTTIVSWRDVSSIYLDF